MMIQWQPQISHHYKDGALCASFIKRTPNGSWEPYTPAPVASGIEAKVCADIAARQQLGINKYGTTVADNPLDLRQWLEHAYQEALDQAIYLRRAMQELDK